jgi:hypothetical protein
MQSSQEISALQARLAEVYSRCSDLETGSQMSMMVGGAALQWCAGAHGRGSTRAAAAPGPQLGGPPSPRLWH